MTRPVTPQAAIDRFLSRFETPVRLLVAVSGGSDSLGLLCLLHASLESGRFPGFSLCAATVDHGLRAGSAEEAVNVSRLCERLGIPHRIALWEGVKPATGLAQAAREVRYDLLCGMADEFQADSILSAHTLGDQIETVMMRAERNETGGGRGLAGMAPAVLLHGRHWLLRPLIGCRREDIRDVLRAGSTPWAEDPSNSNTDYERPRLRARLHAGETPVGTARIETAQQHRMAVCEAAAVFVRTAVVVHGGAAIAVSRQAIDVLEDDAVLSAALSHLAAVAGGRAHPLSEDRMLPVIGLCRSGENGRLNAGRTLFDLRREHLFLTRERRDISSLSIVPGSEAVWDGRYRIANDGGVAMTIIAAGACGEAEWFPDLPPGVARAAAAALPFCVSGQGVAFVLKTPPQPLPTRGRGFTCGAVSEQFHRKSKPSAFSPLVGEMPAGRGGFPDDGPDAPADFSPPDLRIEHFLAPFDRFLPWFDVILAREIAARFGLDRYRLPFRARMR